MGLLDALSGGLTAATDAAAGAEQGKLQGSQLMRAILMQQAQLAREQADTAHTRAQTIGQLRQNEVPLFGTPEYNDAKAAEAGKVALAQLPVEIQKARAQGDIARANLLEGIRARGDVEAALQASRNNFEVGQQQRQQTFQAGQQQRQQTFEAGQQDKRIRGQLGNDVTMQRVKEGGEIVPRIMRKITGSPIPDPNAAQQPMPQDADPFADLHPGQP